ncbi:Myb/SANT-like domain-containing protein [Heracleum sosnowskyi]|uniref:Myb/SANT-like domain-containing protein n=1 Tax=Heracleum sosnowskyi TaxID=360622 RepID=A0AAD8MYS1_9APIA|nr:Myb/SANT-like domain-containing protein [Heracleum sosnowskyi]
MEKTPTEAQKKPRVVWKNESITKTFLEACIREAAENGRQGSSLRPQSWEKVIKTLQQTQNFVVDQRQEKNSYDYTRYKYQAWCRLKNKTGNLYDASTNMFNLSEEEWKQEIQAEPIKTSPLLFPDLCTQLYDGVTATGVNSWGPTAKRSRNNQCQSEVHEVVDSPINVEGQGSYEPPEINPNLEEETPQVPENNNTPKEDSPRPKKKPKQPVNKPINNQFEEKMSKALDIIVQKSNGPTNKECKDKLKSLGGSAENPLYQLALGIFCESESHREAWMNLDVDEAEI